MILNQLKVSAWWFRYLALTHVPMFGARFGSLAGTYLHVQVVLSGVYFIQAFCSPLQLEFDHALVGVYIPS